MEKRRILFDSSLRKIYLVKEKHQILRHIKEENGRNYIQKEDVLISEYILTRSQGLSEKWYSCYRLRFPSSVNKSNSDLLRRLGMSIPSDVMSSVQVCTSCHPHMKKSKMLPLYIGNGFELNSVPSSVTQLNQIEKQMVSFR